jgi:hypothetical protein
MHIEGSLETRKVDVTLDGPHQVSIRSNSLWTPVGSGNGEKRGKGKEGYARPKAQPDIEIKVREGQCRTLCFACRIYQFSTAPRGGSKLVGFGGCH